MNRIFFITHCIYVLVAVLLSYNICIRLGAFMQISDIYIFSCSILYLNRKIVHLKKTNRTSLSEANKCLAVSKQYLIKLLFDI